MIKWLKAYLIYLFFYCFTCFFFKALCNVGCNMLQSSSTQITFALKWATWCFQSICYCPHCCVKRQKKRKKSLAWGDDKSVSCCQPLNALLQNLKKHLWVKCTLLKKGEAEEAYIIAASEKQVAFSRSCNRHEPACCWLCGGEDATYIHLLYLKVKSKQSEINSK